MCDISGGQSNNEGMNDIPTATLHLVPLGHNLTVFLSSVLVEGFVLTIAQDDAFKEGTDLVFRKVVREFTHLIQQVDVLIEDKGKLRLQDGIDEEIDMGFLEDMGHLLEQLIEGDAGLIITLLGDLVETFEVSHFQDGLID